MFSTKPDWENHIDSYVIKYLTWIWRPHKFACYWPTLNRRITVILVLSTYPECEDVDKAFTHIIKYPVIAHLINMFPVKANKWRKIKTSWSSAADHTSWPNLKKFSNGDSEYLIANFIENLGSQHLLYVNSTFHWFFSIDPSIGEKTLPDSGSILEFQLCLQFLMYIRGGCNQTKYILN